MTQHGVEPAPSDKHLAGSAFSADDGAAPAGLVACLASLTSGETDGQQVMAELARSRLLVPVVALLDQADTSPQGQSDDKESSMATVLIERVDGSRTALAFTSTASMTTWRTDARPVPVSAITAAVSALAEGATTLMVDVAGPIPFAVTGADLRVLADALIVPARPTDQDDFQSTVTTAVQDLPGLLDARLRMARVPELTVTVDPSLSEADYRDLLRQVSTRLQGMSALAVAMPQGLRVRVVAPSPEPLDGRTQ